MKKTYIVAGLTALSLAATACGTSTTPAAAPINANTSSTTNTNNGTNSTNTTNNTSSNTTTSPATSANIALAPFQNAAQNGITVNAPVGWTVTPISGGDYMGWKLINPSSPNQQVIIVSSNCVGCYTAPDGSEKPSLVIPEKSAQITNISNSGRTVSYTFATASNPNPGSGMLTLSSDKSGYAYVQVFMPTEEQTTITQILNSFQLTR